MTQNAQIENFAIFTLGRKVGILKVNAQSCLYDMLKSDILATFWCIAFENPFNGD